MDKLKEKWWTKKLKCPKIEDQQDGISVGNIGGVFIVIMVGIVLAIFVLIIEFWYYRCVKPATRIIALERERIKPNAVDMGLSDSGIKKPSEARLRSRTVIQANMPDVTETP